MKPIKDNIASIQIVEDDDDEYVNIEDTDWYKSIELTPATVLKIRRENADMSLAELAKALNCDAGEAKQKDRLLHNKIHSHTGKPERRKMRSGFSCLTRAFL